MSQMQITKKDLKNLLINLESCAKAIKKDRDSGWVKYIFEERLIKTIRFVKDLIQKDEPKKEKTKRASA